RAPDGEPAGESTQPLRDGPRRAGAFPVLGQPTLPRQHARQRLRDTALRRVRRPHATPALRELRTSPWAAAAKRRRARPAADDGVGAGPLRRMELYDRRA